MSELKYWIWLASINGIGSVMANRLLTHFGTAEGVFLARERDYREVGGLRLADIPRLMDKDAGPAGEIVKVCADTGCRIITQHETDYPDRLRNIYDPPVVLYVRGTLPDIDAEPVVGIVGTRNCTQYGLSTAENAGYKLASSGIIVCTGLARGVDAAAARGALRGGGRVIGVVGSGPEIAYPAENKALFGEVERNAAIVSEYPPGTQPAASHFPARNRIISGLSLGVAVIEAPKRSGALLTAARALEQGRDVFALPGNVNARSCEGSNALLREGAIPILSGDDIISEYAELFPDKITQGGAGPQTADKTAETSDEAIFSLYNSSQNDDKKVVDNVSAEDYIDLDQVLGMLDGDEIIIAKALGLSGLNTDDIIVKSGLSAARVLSALTMLEIKRCAKRDSSGIWKLERAD